MAKHHAVLNVFFEGLALEEDEKKNSAHRCDARCALLSRPAALNVILYGSGLGIG